MLYGPFSAAYPGNSVGAVVDYVTRMPDRARDARAACRASAKTSRSTARKARYAGWQASASVGDARGPWSWWLNFNRLDSDAHPVSYANKLVSRGRAGHRGHGRHGRARRPQPAQPGLADPRLDDGDAHDPGSREAQGRLRDFAAPARELHARLVGQRRAALVRDLSARRGRQPRLLGRDQRRRPPLHGDARGLRADGRRSAPSDARAVASRPSATAPGTTSSPRASTTTTATSCARRRSHCPTPRAAARGASRTRTARAGPRWRCARRAGPTTRAATSSTSGFSSTTIGLRTLVSNADDWLAGAPTTSVLGVSRRHRAREPVRAGHLGVRGRRGARRSACASSAGSAANGAVADAATTVELRRALRDLRVAEARDRARADAAVERQGVARPRRALPDGRGALSGLDRVERHRQQRPESASPRSRGRRSSPASACSGPAACGSRRSSRTRPTRSTRRRTSTVTPNVTNIQNVDEIGTRGLEIAFAAARLASATGSMSRPASRTRARGSSETTTSPRASASGSRACPTGARTRS